jgi:hypothetical protein
MHTRAHDKVWCKARAPPPSIARSSMLLRPLAERTSAGGRAPVINSRKSRGHAGDEEAARPVQDRSVHADDARYNCREPARNAAPMFLKGVTRPEPLRSLIGAGAHPCRWALCVHAWENRARPTCAVHPASIQVGRDQARSARQEMSPRKVLGARRGVRPARAGRVRPPTRPAAATSAKQEMGGIQRF